MSRPGRLVLIPALVAALSGLGAKPVPAPAPPTVVLVTMDGVRWDYPGRDHLPAFAAMAADGLKAGRLVPPFPSLTFTSHTTLATGCLPARHGIVANSFLDPDGDRRFGDGREASWVEEPPLWALCERAGLRAAVAGWPCSTGPWEGATARDVLPFDEHRSDAATVDWILGLLRRPPTQRPRLVMAWTRGADSAGHAQGPDGEAVHAAMRAADATLARLRLGLAELGTGTRVDLLVASDHGMAAVDRTIDVAKVIPKRGFYPYIATSGPVCNVYVKGGAQRREVARALRRLPADVRVYARGQVPAALGYSGNPRIGDFVLVAPPGAFFAGFGRRGHEALPKGMHGYPPADEPRMDGILYAEGPDFPAGRRLDEVRAVDVAPTVCRILGLPPPPHADGRSFLGGP